jgi:hypothetical protein
MGASSAKRIVLAGLAVVVLIGGILWFVHTRKAPIPQPQISIATTTHAVIGRSVENREIEEYTFGNGKTHLLFVGGIHGGYEWNSVLLAYQLVDYLKQNPAAVPENISVSIIPSANPDGLFDVVGKEGRFSLADVPGGQNTAGVGRFNAHNVDLNRNFDCKWKPESTWRSKVVSAGNAAFSEPESRAIRDFVLKNNPAAVIFFHSQANAVYASECNAGILPATFTIMNTYSKASGYKAVSTFDAYEVTGDAEGWLASINIPAITVELQTHETIEWDRNLAGIKALFEYYRNK